jgi:hypothetical protein
MTPNIINIVAAQQVRDYCIHLRFDDGTDQVVDFKPFLSHSLHPDIRCYLDPSQFPSFRLEYGELVWGDYDLCFPIIDLYRNDLEHRHSEIAAAEAGAPAFSWWMLRTWVWEASLHPAVRPE